MLQQPTASWRHRKNNNVCPGDDKGTKSPTVLSDLSLIQNQAGFIVTCRSDLIQGGREIRGNYLIFNPYTMKAACFLYQTPHNIFEEKLDKEGKKKKLIKMIDVKITKELVQKFPGLKEKMKPHKTLEGQPGIVLKYGDMVRVPDAVNPKNIIMTKTVIFEAEFMFPEKTANQEEVWASAFAEASKKISKNLDKQTVLNDHIRWMLTQGWELSGFFDTRYAFTKEIQ